MHRNHLYLIISESRKGFVFMVMEQQNGNHGPWWRQGVKLMSDVSTWIIIPIVLALIAGKYLDQRFGTEPKLLLILAGASFLFTAYGITKTVKEYTKNLKK